MGREIAEAVPEAMAVYERGSEASGLDLQQLCFDGAARGAGRDRDAAAGARRDEPRDACAALRARGHRAGLRRRPLGRRVLGAGRGRRDRASPRRSRSCASAGWRWPRPRGERPARWPRSSASTTRWSRGSAAEIDGVWPANYNCPGQIVVSGEHEAVDELLRRGRSRRGARRAVQAQGLGRVPQPARRARGRAAAAGGRARSLHRARRRRSCRRSPRGSSRRSGSARCSSTS